MGCHFLLQGIFLTQESNLGLRHCRQTLLPSGPPGKSKGSRGVPQTVVGCRQMLTKLGVQSTLLPGWSASLIIVLFLFLFTDRHVLFHMAEYDHHTVPEFTWDHFKAGSTLSWS